MQHMGVPPHTRKVIMAERGTGAGGWCTPGNNYSRTANPAEVRSRSSAGNEVGGVHICLHLIQGLFCYLGIVRYGEVDSFAPRSKKGGLYHPRIPNPKVEREYERLLRFPRIWIGNLVLHQRRGV